MLLQEWWAEADAADSARATTEEMLPDPLPAAAVELVAVEVVAAAVGVVVGVDVVTKILFASNLVVEHWKEYFE